MRAQHRSKLQHREASLPAGPWLGPTFQVPVTLGPRMSAADLVRVPRRHPPRSIRDRRARRAAEIGTGSAERRWGSGPHRFGLPPSYIPGVHCIQQFPRREEVTATVVASPSAEISTGSAFPSAIHVVVSDSAVVGLLWLWLRSTRDQPPPARCLSRFFRVRTSSRGPPPAHDRTLLA